MALESVTYISDLVITNPTGSDAKSQGDDHIRNIKKALANSFTGITGAVSVTHTELNHLSGVSANIQAQLDTLSLSVSAINASVSALNTTVDALSLSVSALNTTVDALSLSVSANNTRIGALSASVATLEASVSAINTALDGMYNSAVSKFSNTLNPGATHQIGVVGGTKPFALHASVFPSATYCYANEVSVSGALSFYVEYNATSARLNIVNNRATTATYSYTYLFMNWPE